MRWQDIHPADAITLDLSRDLHITAPLNEEGERCPWPWEPQQRKNAPIGMYHCDYCGAMVLAGHPHTDYGPTTGNGYASEPRQVQTRDDPGESRIS